MRILYSMKNIIEVEINSLNDLYYLSLILKPKDEVSTYSSRIVKFGNKEERKRVWLKLEIEKISFSPYQNKLRITGIIKEGKPIEFIQLGKFHSFDISIGDRLKIEKEWLDIEKKQLKEAEKNTKRANMYAILIDDKQANIFEIRIYGNVKIANFTFQISKKMTEKDIEKEKKKVFEEIRAILDKNKMIVIGGNTSLSKEFYELLKNHKYNVLFVKANGIEENTLNELMNNELKDIIQAEQLREANKFFTEFMKRIVHNMSSITYGYENVKDVLEKGIVDVILIDSKALTEPKMFPLIKKADEYKVKIIIVPNKTELGLKIRGFGSIIALLNKWST